MPMIEMPVILPVLPEIVVALSAMFVLIADLFLDKDRKQWNARFAIMACVAAAVVILRVDSGTEQMAFYGFFQLDGYAVFMKFLLLASTVFAVILSQQYMRGNTNEGEYYSLMLFALCGMMLMVSAADFVTLYLGIELMSLSLYVLVGFQRDVLRSTEAALKYFVLGALSSCLLLYGITFFYGITGETSLSAIGEALMTASPDAAGALMLGMVFMLAGMAFKISLAPFHMWTPDAYEGAPTPITAFMSVAPKVAGFSILLRVLAEAWPALHAEYITVLCMLAIMSMVIGNVAAIAQRSIKRMLAYSTVGHVGFILLGLIAASPDGYAAMMLYMSIYLFMGMGAFAMVIILRREGFEGELLDDFSGLSKSHPGYALAMGVFMFSLAGIPFMGGFWAKYAVFAAVIDAGYIWMALIGIIFSVIGAFYYLRVVKHMYFDEQKMDLKLVDYAPVRYVIALSALIVVAIGIYPEPLMAACRAALEGFI